jgi:CubicO group peptidase (beta-lactamase class C family)
MRRMLKAGLKTLLAAVLVVGNLSATGSGAQAQDATSSAQSAAPATAAPMRASSQAAPAPQTAAPATGARLRAGEPIPQAELEAYVDGVVRQAMAADHIAGVTVSVVQNGQVVLKKGYGFARLDSATPVDPDKTLFRIASISKTFTWIAVMKEVEAHAMRLDAPVNLYLPEKLQVRDQGFDKPVLVRDLMNHTAGFEDRVLGQLFEAKARRIRPLDVYLKQESPRRVRDPGTLSSYSNYGAALAGEAASYVARKPFESLIESEITGPLHLDHTTFREPYEPRDGLPAPMPAALAANVSEGYRWSGGAFQVRPFEYISQSAPSSAASSTAGDMARYMSMILAGGQLDGAAIYSPDTAAGFRRTAFTNAPGLDGWDNGFAEFTLPGGVHGQGQDGATLSFSAKMVVAPDLNLGVFIAANTESGAPLVQRFADGLVGRFYAPAADLPRAGSPELGGKAAVYSGTYVTTRRAYGGLEKFVDLLNGGSHVSISRDGHLIIGRAGSAPEAFSPDGADGHFRSTNGLEPVVFDIKNGRADRWMMSGAVTYDRASLWSTVAALAALAGLTGLVCLGLLGAIVTRDRRDFRETAWQARASLLHVTIAILFLLALAAFGLWATGTGDITRIVYHWPGPLLLIASACCLVAALLTLVAVGIAPLVWRGGRRLDSWSAGQKLRFTASTLLFLVFSVVLLHWGALAPWIS